MSIDVGFASRATRLRQKDTVSLEDRSRDRYRRVALTALSGGVGKAVSIAISLVSIPLAVGYLGPERFGLWITLSSLSAFFGLADLGIGSGVVNAVARANGSDDVAAARGSVSSAFFALLGIAISLGALYFMVQPGIAWDRVFNTSSAEAADEIGTAVAIFVGCWLLSLPFTVSQKVESGYQEGFIGGLWSAVGSLLSFAGLLLAINLGAGLPWLVLALAGAPATAVLLNYFVLFYRRKPELRPAFRYVTRSRTLELFTAGGLFLVMHLSGVLGYESDYLIVARLLGPEEVAQYAVPMKLFLAAPLILGLVLTPLWPAYGEAISRGDADWVRKTFKRSVFVGISITAAAAAFLVPFGRGIVIAWAGPEIQPTVVLLSGLGMWCLLHGLGGPFSMLLNGAGKLRFQALTGLLMGLANFGLSLWLVGKIGIAGAVFGTVMSQTIAVLIPSSFYIRKLFRDMEIRCLVNGSTGYVTPMRDQKRGEPFSERAGVMSA